MPKGNVYLGRRFQEEEAKDALKASEEGRLLYEKPRKSGGVLSKDVC
jgi:hypothetical protein